MSKKIFVGNLSFNTTESDLDGLFAQIGAVESVAIITDRTTGRSKGFGFVEMSNEDADAAIAKARCCPDDLSFTSKTSEVGILPQPLSLQGSGLRGRLGPVFFTGTRTTALPAVSY